MYYLQAIILGAAQGITEFLPISSTAHLILLQDLFNLDQDTFGLTFDMFTNLGTTIALIWYFWPDITRLLKKFRLPSKAKPLQGEEKVPWWIIGATIIPALLGLVLEDTIATTFRSLWVIVFTLVIVGVAMLIADKKATATTSKKEATGKVWYTVGAAQALAFLPGVSRSGATMTTGVFMGLSREQAARTSFLLSIPITAAASLKRVGSFFLEGQAGTMKSADIWFYAIATLTALLVGYITVKFLLKYLQSHSLSTFSYYRFALALLVAAYLVI